MHKRRLAVLTATLAVALAALTGTASAALLSDLTALGYTVSAATQCENTAHVWVNVWYVSGFGTGAYLSECDPDFQASLDAIANPAGHCNRKWSFTRPEQVDPWSAIDRLGWTTTADKCGDVFTVANPNDQTVRYTGPGSGLVELALTIGAPPVPPPPVVTPPAPPAPHVSTPTPEPPAPVAAPLGEAAATETATTTPAAVIPAEPVATAPRAMITLTPAQLKALIVQAVTKAVAKAMKQATAQAKKKAARAQRPKPSSSPLKSRAHRR